MVERSSVSRTGLEPVATILYPGTVAKLAAKAEHPDNQDVLIFQTQMMIGGSLTRFARYFEPGNNLAAKIFRRVNYHVFDRSAYYGHNALIRRKQFQELSVPDWILSHDLWETAAIDAAGQRVAFCEDVLSEEMYPSTFLEDRARTRRWILGTIEALPLLFRRGLTVGTRFYLALPLYMYFMEVVFLFWILLGLFAHNSVTGALIAAQPLLLAGAVGLDLEMGGMCAGTLSIAWFYKLWFCRRRRDLVLMLREILIGTAVVLNNLLYHSWSVLVSPFGSKAWRPMKKEPAEDLSYRTAFWEMLPSTSAGIILLSVGLTLAPMWTLLASPILLSFLLGSVTVYWTSKTIRVER